MQGGIVHGLNAALWGEQGFIAGKAVKKNFNTARMLKASEMPNVDVVIVESGQQYVGGVGEPGVPPIAPAVANAYFRLTGIQRGACSSPTRVVSATDETQLKSKRAQRNCAFW